MTDEVRYTASEVNARFHIAFDTLARARLMGVVTPRIESTQRHAHIVRHLYTRADVTKVQAYAENRLRGSRRAFAIRQGRPPAPAQAPRCVGEHCTKLALYIHPATHQPFCRRHLHEAQGR